MPVVQAQRALGLVSDGGKCVPLSCDFSPAKCAPLTNELRDHTPLESKEKTVRRNVKGLFERGTREHFVCVRTEARHAGVSDDHTSG